MLYPPGKILPPPAWCTPWAFCEIFSTPKLGKFQKSSTPQLKLGGYKLWGAYVSWVSSSWGVEIKLAVESCYKLWDIFILFSTEQFSLAVKRANCKFAALYLQSWNSENFTKQRWYDKDSCQNSIIMCYVWWCMMLYSYI